MNIKNPEQKWREMRDLKEELNKLLMDIYDFNDAGISAILENRIAVAMEILTAKMAAIRDEHEF